MERPLELIGLGCLDPRAATSGRGGTVRPPFVTGDQLLHGPGAYVISPTGQHADLREDGYCPAHDGGARGYHRWTPDSEFPRLWRVRGRSPVRASGVVGSRWSPSSGRDPEKHGLDPGTRLRLDATWAQRFYAPDFCSVTWRFCVLDGPWAGTCWEMSDAVLVPYDEWPIGAPVEPLTLP